MKNLLKITKVDEFIDLPSKVIDTVRLNFFDSNTRNGEPSSLAEINEQTLHSVQKRDRMLSEMRKRPLTIVINLVDADLLLLLEKDLHHLNETFPTCDVHRSL